MPSTAIVPYAPRRAYLTTLAAMAGPLRKYGRYGLKSVDPRVQIAAKVIQGAYRNRRYIGYATKRIAGLVKTRGYRRKGTKWGKRMEKTSKVHVEARQDGHATGNALLPLGGLSFQLIDTPLPSTSIASAAFSSRLWTDKLLIRGIRFCRQFEFLRPSEAVAACPPIQMHWAVVQLKDADMDPGTYGTEFRKAFFRSNNDYDDRFTPFVDTGGWSSYKNCCSMNPDAEFNILTHQKKTMIQNGEFPRPPSGSNVEPYQYIWQIDKYITIKKSVDFRKTNSSVATHPLVELFWYETLTPTNYPAALSNVVATWKCHTMYFKTIK